MFRPAGELAALVASGEISATELVSASLAQIDALDGSVGAFVEVDHEGALNAAAEIKRGDQRPFAGVPIAIKNNRAVQGLRLTQGAALMRDFIAPYDHGVVARLRRAGFVIVGTTKLPEFGILPVTEPAVHGPARNPWDLSRTPGGSSGGAAAAVAAGMVPVAHGNDGGGSLRIPAACCGLVGLKAQRHRVSSAPELGASALVVDGVITRTVAETAALLDVLAGREVGDAAWTPPGERFANAAAHPPGTLRIAFTTLPPIASVQLDRRCVEATEHAAILLASLGHSVEEVTPPWQSDDVADLFGDYFAAHVAVGIYFAALAGGRPEPQADDMEPLSWALWERCQQMSAVAFQALQTQLQARMRALVSFLSDYDALLTPALAQRPLPLGTLDAAAPDPLGTFARSGQFTPFTPIFNASGQPAISLPLCHGDDGLPLGVQLAGREAGEGTLLALAAQIEAAEPWAGRHPALIQRDPAPPPSSAA
ncbi:MAG: amidase [Solirubrobacteraceae bacterium]